MRLSPQWQAVIFMINGKANHVGLSIPEVGLADLSLLGARIIPWTHPKLPNGDRLFFNLFVPEPEKAHDFLKRPGVLCQPILEQERANRGWYATWDAPDFVRTLRNERSTDPANMNCIEWIVYALELAGVSVPPAVMTPTEFLNWCQAESL